MRELMLYVAVGWCRIGKSRMIFVEKGTFVNGMGMGIFKDIVCDRLIMST